MERNKIKLWHISDTHTNHELLTIPEGVKIVVFSGDCSNPKDPIKNEPQVREFIEWFAALPIEHKIFVPGNHETSIENGLVTREDFESRGIIYLHNEYTTIDGYKFFGSPNQPTYGKGWAFNIPRHKIDLLWNSVDDDVDVFIVHGPPKTVLDLSYEKYNGHLEFCGCKALRRHIFDRIKPTLCLFGHIHNNKDIINAGVVKFDACPTIFSNGSCVTDNLFGVITSNGNILEI